MNNILPKLFGGVAAITTALSGVLLPVLAAPTAFAADDATQPAEAETTATETAPSPFAPKPGLEQLGGANRYETAVKLSARYYQPGVKAVFLASGENFPDALSASGVAGTLESPVLLTQKNVLPGVVADEIKRLAPQRLVIVGGPGAISEGVESAVADLLGKAKIQRVAGQNRFETALNLAKHETLPGIHNAIFIANGMNFPDALSASAAAARRDSAVLLIMKDEVPASVMDFLKQNQPDSVHLAGGEGVISEDVSTDLFLTAGLPDVRRDGGDNRFDTARILGLHHCGILDRTLLVANGMTFPDALALSALAGNESLDGACMFLTEKDNVPAETLQGMDLINPKNVIIAGGPGAVAPATAQKIEEAAKASYSPYL